MFVFSMIVAGIAVVALLIAIFAKNPIAWIVTAVSIIVSAVLLFFATFYQNGVGEAKVVVNSIDKTIVGTVETPGSGFKAPLNDFVDFDLFSQQLTFAGGGDGGPSYTGGSVSGNEITVNVGGVSGGSTRANVDLVATYSLGTEEIEKIYSEFRSQERFTEQVIQKQVLSIARQVPANYSAVEFRGTQRGAAEEAIRKALNERLEEYAVEFTSVTIQDVRYPDSVETALTQIEEANQNAQKAEADKRTAEVNAEKALIEAEGVANAQIEKARGEAEANRLLSKSLTPEVVELRRIEALAKAAESGSMIIDGGQGNLLLQPGAITKAE